MRKQAMTSYSILVSAREPEKNCSETGRNQEILTFRDLGPFCWKPAVKLIEKNTIDYYLLINYTSPLSSVIIFQHLYCLFCDFG